MYLIVVTDDRFACRTASILDDYDAVRVALQAFSPEHGFSTMVFKLNPATEAYYEIFPEVDYDI